MEPFLDFGLFEALAVAGLLSFGRRIMRILRSRRSSPPSQSNNAGAAAAAMPDMTPEAPLGDPLDGVLGQLQHQGRR
jgi:hypothetical protein